MGRLKNQQEIIDYGATLREWPKKIWSWEEVPDNYRTFIDSMREQGMPLSAMVWVPQKGYERGSYEYMGIHYNGRITLLMPEEDGDVREVSFAVKDIVYVQDLEYMLNCEYRFFYREKGQIKRVALPYNQAVQYLFLPFLNMALGLSEDFSFSQRMKDNPRPEHLLHDDHALYSYSEAAFRMGERILDYQWGTYEVASRRLFFYTKKQCAWMLCHTKGGDCLIEYGANYHETIYLPCRFGTVAWEEDKSLLRLEATVNEEVYTVKELFYSTKK